MHFSSLILGLAAGVSAIDVRAHANDNCGGGYASCVNLNPGVCCSYSSSVTSGWASVAVVAIPSNWRIRTQAWTGGGCSYFGGEQDSAGATSVCLRYTTRGDRTGGSYFFLSRKRAEDQLCPAEQPDGQKCEAFVEFNTIGLADGTEYNVTGLSQEKIKILEEIAVTNAGADAVPAEFQVLRR